MNIRPPNGIPVIGQQKALAEAGIMQAVQQLSMSIYTQVASDYLSGNVRCETIDTAHLQQVARDAQKSAQAFFEGLGVATFSKPESPG